MRGKFGSILIWAILLWIIVVWGLFFNDTLKKEQKAADARETELLAELAVLRSSMNLMMEQFMPVVHEYVYTSPIHLDDFERYSSPYGIRDNPLKPRTGGSKVKFHGGVDIVGVPEARVTAVSTGIVLDKYYPRGWHNGRWYNGHDLYDGYIRLGHINEQGELTGVITHYGHLGEMYVHEGDIVVQGDTMARINENKTAGSTGPHLHFAIEITGQSQPPFKYVDMP